MTRFDVLVVGGGPAGLAAAIALRELDHSVVVVERSSYERRRIIETLPPETRIPLAELDLWDEFLALGCTPTPGRLSVWGTDPAVEADYLFNPYGHAWLVPRPAFEKMLVPAAGRRGVEVLVQARVQRCRQRADTSWEFTVSQNGTTQRIVSSFIIAATGRGSSLLRGAEEFRDSEDRLIGVTARVSRPSHWGADDHRPLVEATAEGWWYSVLLPDGQVELAMMTDADIAQRHVEREGSYLAALHALLQHAPQTFARLNHRFDVLASPDVVAANSYFNRRIAGHAKLSIGDCAQAIDPLSGQGSFAAIEGGIRAARAISQYRAGDPGTLQRYANEEYQRFRQSMRDRLSYYRLERRWPNSLFWERRHIEPATSF